MAVSKAKTGLGTKVFVTKAGTGTTKFELQEIKDVQLPTSSKDEIDVSHMGSPGGIKEFIPGMKDLGEVALPMNWVPGSATDLLLVELEASSEIVTLEFQLVGTPAPAPKRFLAFVKTYANSAPVNEALSAEVTWRIVGIPAA